MKKRLDNVVNASALRVCLLIVVQALFAFVFIAAALEKREQELPAMHDESAAIAGTNAVSIPPQTSGVSSCTNDTWTPTTLTGAPSARDGHTAVWTGNEMIVWGGGGFATGGRYNPGTDTWTITSSINAPSGRSNHTAIWTGTEMIV